MGFKLGTARKLQATSGEVRSKFKFHQEAGGDASVPGTPVIRKDLEEGVLGEANMDGSIYISNNIEPGSFEETQTIMHEMRHSTDMKIGKTGYTDDYVMYNGEKFPRETRNGKVMILVDGQWREAGWDVFPWENDANNGTV